MDRLTRIGFVAALLASGGCLDGESSVDNNTASVIVDENGGSVSLAGATVSVPPGAVADPTQVSISLTGNPPAALPADRTFAGPVFMITPHGQRFAEPVSIIFPRQGNAIELWSLAGPDDDLWKLEAHAELQVDRATLVTTHFSYFAWLLSNERDSGATDAGDADSTP